MSNEQLSNRRAKLRPPFLPCRRCAASGCSSSGCSSASAVDAGTEPPRLNGRIAQAKTSATTELLKTLGAASVDEAKVAVEAARVAADAKKSAELKRAAELDGQLKSASQQRDELRGRRQGARGSSSRRSRPSNSWPSRASRETIPRSSSGRLTRWPTWADPRSHPQARAACGSRVDDAGRDATASGQPACRRGPRRCL